MIMILKDGSDYTQVRSITLVHDCTSPDGYFLLHFDDDHHIAIPVRDLEEIVQEGIML